LKIHIKKYSYKKKSDKKMDPTVQSVVVGLSVFFGMILILVLVFFGILSYMTDWFRREDQHFCAHATAPEFTVSDINVLQGQYDTDDHQMYRPEIAVVSWKLIEFNMYMHCPDRRSIVDFDHWLPRFVRLKDFHHEHGVFYHRKYYYGTALYSQQSNTMCFIYTSTRSLGHWETDLRFRQQHPEALRSSTPNMRIHRGMYEIFSHLYAETRTLLRNYQPARIFMLGHSLGGAISTLMSMDLACSPNSVSTKIYNYTFGAPRIGNKEFVRQFHQTRLKISHFRIVNVEDIIPSLPPPHIHVYCIVHARYAHTKQVVIPFTKTKKTATQSHSTAYKEFVYRNKCQRLLPEKELVKETTIAVDRDSNNHRRQHNTNTEPCCCRCGGGGGQDRCNVNHQNDTDTTTCQTGTITTTRTSTTMTNVERPLSVTRDIHDTMNTTQIEG